MSTLDVRIIFKSDAMTCGGLEIDFLEESLFSIFKIRISDINFHLEPLFEGLLHTILFLDFKYF